MAKLTTGNKIAIIISCIVFALTVAGGVLAFLYVSKESAPDSSSKAATDQPLNRQVSGEELFYSDVALFKGYDYTATYDAVDKDVRNQIIAMGKKACNELASDSIQIPEESEYLYFLAAYSLCTEHKEKVDAILSSQNPEALIAFQELLFDGTEYLSVLQIANSQCVTRLVFYTVAATPDDHLMLCNILRSYFESDWKYVVWLYDDQDEVGRTLEKYSVLIGDPSSGESVVTATRKLQSQIDSINTVLDEQNQ